MQKLCLSLFIKLLFATSVFAQQQNIAGERDILQHQNPYENGTPRDPQTQTPLIGPDYTASRYDRIESPLCPEILQDSSFSHGDRGMGF